MAANDLAALAQVRALCRSGAARSIRMAADLSLREVVARIEPPVSPSTLLRWEQGDARPTGPAALSYGELLQGLLKPGRGAA